MNHTDTVTPRQLTAAAFVAVLSPLIRRFPRVTAATAGPGAWLAPILAAVPLALLGLGLWLFFHKTPAGSGFADLLCRILGKPVGRAVTGLYGLWFLAYAAFLLRSGAERFLATVYPGAGAAVFILVTAALCLPAAMGRLCPVARCAMLFRPLLLGLFIVVFALTARDLDPALLLPVTGADLPGVAGAALQLAGGVSAGAFVVFFADRVDKRAGPGHAVAWTAVLLAVLLIMTVGCLGMFGAGLTARMSYPFFLLVRDLTALGTLERAEPVVIALWVLSDFVMLSLLLQAAGKNLRFCAGTEGCRWLSPVCVAAAAGAALALPAEAETFRFLSDTVVPLVHGLLAFGLPLPVLVIGLIRKRV